jgi:hypothetical protein
MNFASAVEKMSAGLAVRRREWPAWRTLRVVRKTATLPHGAFGITLDRCDKILHNMDPGYWGMSHWRPLLRDVLAEDWEVVEGQG